MKTIEEFDAEQAKARAEFLAKRELHDSLPVAPQQITYQGRTSWVTHRVQTIEQAADLIRQYGPRLEMVCAESGCTCVEPARYLRGEYAKVAPRWVVQEAIELRQHGGRGFYTANIEFYPEDKPIMVIIEVAQFPWKHRISVCATYTHQGDVSRAEITGGEDLKHKADRALSFGSGSRDAFDRRFFFSNLDHMMKVLQS